MSHRHNRPDRLHIYKSDDIEEALPSAKEQPSIWAQYNRKAASFDNKLMMNANDMTAVLLIFSGLFSIVTTMFLSQTYSLLQPNPQDTMTAILNELRGTRSTTPDIKSHSAIRSNCFLAASLSMSMLVALLSILVREWIRSYRRNLEGVSSPHLRARIRYFRYLGLERWRFTHIVGLLFVFMNFALFFFAIGIIDLYLTNHFVVGCVALGVFACGIIVLAVTTLLPLFAPDTPFRTPFLTLIMNMNGSIYRRVSKRWRRHDSGEKKEALQDYIDQSQGVESRENNVMRTKVHLDLDILSHLLGVADKSTERRILDSCFEKLPQLELLAKEDPSSILRRDIILEVYGFLANDCIITNSRGQMELDPHRARRVKILCKFIAWFLSLRRTLDEKANIELILADQFDDPCEFPKLITSGMLPRDTNTIVAYSALGRLEHLCVRVDTPQCSLCRKSANILRQKVFQQLGTSLAPQRADNALVRDITEFLVKRTDCLLFWNWAEESNWQKDSSRGQRRDLAASDHLELILDALRAFTLPVKEKTYLSRIIDEKGANAAVSLRKDWFEPLIECLGTPLARSSTEEPVLLESSGRRGGKEKSARRPLIWEPVDFSSG